MKLKRMLKMQKKFSKNFYDVENLTEEQRIEKHKTLCLAMHSELSQLAESVHFREHRTAITPTHRQNILFETMDVYRYCLAILNLWEYDENDAHGAFMSRDAHLNCRTAKNWSKWNGQDVVIVDVDDVIARFRMRFYEWINETYDENLEDFSSEYFLSQPVQGKAGDVLLQEFIDAGNLRNLPVNKNVINGLQKLRESGYWIHILTARPSTELKCLNETYEWLENHVREFDSVQLSSEKYIAMASLPAYAAGKIVCAIDDSPKHAAEYAMHGIKCLVPMRNYNEGVWNHENIVPFNWETGDIKSRVDDIKVDNSTD